MEGFLERHVAKKFLRNKKLNGNLKLQPNLLRISGELKYLLISREKIDAAVYSREKHKVWLIETNYYGGEEVN